MTVACSIENLCYSKGGSDDFWRALTHGENVRSHDLARDITFYPGDEFKQGPKDGHCDLIDAINKVWPLCPEKLVLLDDSNKTWYMQKLFAHYTPVNGPGPHACDIIDYDDKAWHLVADSDLQQHLAGPISHETLQQHLAGPIGINLSVENEEKLDSCVGSVSADAQEQQGALDINSYLRRYDSIHEGSCSCNTSYYYSRSRVSTREDEEAEEEEEEEETEEEQEETQQQDFDIIEKYDGDDDEDGYACDITRSYMQRHDDALAEPHRAAMRRRLQIGVSALALGAVCWSAYVHSGRSRS